MCMLQIHGPNNLLLLLCLAAYDMHGMVEFAEPVPFRLTRNLQTFFTPFGVEGLFVSSMCAAAQAVVAPKVSSMILFGMTNPDETDCSNRLLIPFRFTKKRPISETLEICSYEC